MAQENGMCKYGESSCHLSRGITKQVNLWNHKQNSVLQKNQFSDGKIACCFLKPTLPPRGNHQGFLRRSSKPKSMKAPEGSKPWGSSPPEREHQGTMSEKPWKTIQKSSTIMDIHGYPWISDLSGCPFCVPLVTLWLLGSWVISPEIWGHHKWWKLCIRLPGRNLKIRTFILPQRNMRLISLSWFLIMVSHHGPKPRTGYGCPFTTNFPIQICILSFHL